MAALAIDLFQRDPLYDLSIINQPKKHRNRVNSNKPDLGVFEDTINLHMEKLYSTHLPNLKYKNFWVYIDPENPNRSFPLTVGAAQTWAQALARTSIHCNS
ncbi:uncharacterized protein VP01_218g10 [Puccinia sorghi]|uniref:Uncharacterized protein n=1 Tax=Puccinia sorghi TaxID=27349 RepID=A0A0L6V9S2_9BASI|nr:uncharacterized protein VP01_218g10 [Puccinia sorghi]